EHFRLAHECSCSDQMPVRHEVAPAKDMKNLSGKEAALLSPPPLRTDRASFPAISSSLSNALFGTRLHDLRLCRLDDTRLEPTHVLIDCSPVDGRPVDLFVGDRTSLCFHCCHPLCPQYR